MASFGLDYNAYVNGKLMDRATAEKLFDYHYNMKVAQVNRDFPGLRYSSEREVLIDMSFNIGSLTGFSKLQQAARNNDPKGMAIEILDSAYCTQVKTRCLKNALNLLGDASGPKAQTLRDKV
jgi:hypothetical protein